MVDRYINNLILEGEHQTLDFKFEVSNSKKIARSLVAFANTDGGRLLIGVKDNGRIVGVRSDEEVYMIETAAHIYCKPEVNYDAVNHIIDGKHVVEVIVKPSVKKPHYAPDKDNKLTAYIRVKDENRIANNVIIKVWKRENLSRGVLLKFTDIENRLLTHIEQVGEITFLIARQITGVNRNKVENILANFISIGIIEPVFSEDKVSYQITTSGNYTF